MNLGPLAHSLLETLPFFQPIPGCVHDRVDCAMAGRPIEQGARLVSRGDKTRRVAFSTETFRSGDLTSGRPTCDLNDFAN